MKKVIAGLVVLLISTPLLSGCSSVFGEIDPRNPAWERAMAKEPGVKRVEARQQSVWVNYSPDLSIIVEPDANLDSILNKACITEVFPESTLLVTMENEENTRRASQSFSSTCAKQELLPLKSYLERLPANIDGETLEVEFFKERILPTYSARFDTYNPKVINFVSNNILADNKEEWETYTSLSYRDYIKILQEFDDIQLSFSEVLTRESEFFPYDGNSFEYSRMNSSLKLDRSEKRALSDQERLDLISILKEADKGSVILASIFASDEGVFNLVGYYADRTIIASGTDVFPNVKTPMAVEYGESNQLPNVLWSEFSPENTKEFIQSVKNRFKGNDGFWDYSYPNIAVREGDQACRILRDSGIQVLEAVKADTLISGGLEPDENFVLISMEEATVYLCPELVH